MSHLYLHFAALTIRPLSIETATEALLLTLPMQVKVGNSLLSSRNAPELQSNLVLS
jgi:hypothetical protein